MMWPWNKLKQILKADSGDFSDSAVIVWPVMYPADMLPPEDPHVTVFFFPDVVGDNIGKEALIRIIEDTQFDVFPVADVKGLSWFGPLQDVPVLELDSEYLVKYRDALKVKLDALGINYSQRFPDYKPHVTITQEGATVGLWPTKVVMKPVQLWYRDEKVRIFK